MSDSIKTTDLSALSDAFDSVLEKQAKDDQNIAGVVRAIASELELITGACPVQIEGELPDGNYLYFRARGDSWEVSIASTESEVFEDSRLYHVEGWYGDLFGFDAGWMPHATAWAIVGLAVIDWLKSDDRESLEALLKPHTAKVKLTLD